MNTLTVGLGDRSYPIHIGVNAAETLGEELKRIEVKGIVAVCTDSNVAGLYGQAIKESIEASGLRAVLCVMPAGEESKRLARVEEFCGMLLEAGLDRSSVRVALGGGVPGAVAGYPAASFMRGIRFIQIPTTVLAQVDSSVGGKTGVNHPLGKNTIGAFHQPSSVIIDMAMLKTLPDRELRAGLAEVIKHGMIADLELFEFLEASAVALLAKEPAALEHVVRRSCEIKSGVVAKDEKETGIRAILNYGHTFGHGIESVTGYGVYLHGEGVAMGMHAAAVLSRDLGLIGADVVKRQRACIEALGLPVRWPELPVDETLGFMKKDKKVRAGQMKFVVVEGIGRAALRTDVTETQARAALVAVRGNGPNGD